MNWTGGGDGSSWSDADNWSSAPTLPGSTDTVHIDQAAASVTLDTDAQVYALELTGVGASITQSANTLTIDSSATIGADATYTLNGGTLDGDGDITFQGQMNWGGGTHSGNGFTTLAAGADGLWDGGNKTLIARAFFVQDTVTWTSGTMYLETGATLYNDEVIELQNTSDANISSGILGHLNNQGIFRKSGTGSTTLSGQLAFNSDDSLIVDEGVFTINSGGDTHDGPFVVAAGATLDFASGTHTLNGNLTGSGAVDFSGGSVALSPAAGFDFPSLWVTGGTASFAGPVAIADSIWITVGSATFQTLDDITVPRVVQSGGTLTGSDNFIVTDSLIWSGGTQSGSGATTLAADAGARWYGGTKALDTRTLTLADTLWWYSGYLTMANGAAFVNNGVVGLDALEDVSISGSGSFANNGVFRDEGIADTYISVPFDNADSLIVDAGTFTFNNGDGTHTGPIVVAAGATLDFANGIHTLSNELTGLGVVDFGTTVSLAASANYNLPGILVTAGAATFNGPVTVSDSIRLTVGTLTFDTPATDITVPRVVQVSGTLTGPDNLIVTDSLLWGSGTQSGAGATTIAAGGAGLWDGGSKTLDTRSLTIADTVLWTAGNFNLANSASITNFGVVELQNADGASLSGVGSLMNNGLFRKSAAGYSAIGVLLSNSDTVEVLAGATLNLTGGIAHTAGAGLTGGGTLDVSGDLAVNGDVSVNTLVIGGALTAGTGLYSAPNTTFDANGQLIPVLPYTNILVTGSATFSDVSPITITGDVVAGGTVAIAGATVTVNGGFSAEGGRLSMVDAAGTLNVLGNASFIGMSTSGFLTAGTLTIGGDFTQENLLTSDQSFAASGSHTTLFNGTGLQSVFFANPDSLAGGSHFSRLLISQTEGPLELGSHVYADSARVDDFNSTAPVVINGPGELILRGDLVMQEDNYGLDVSPAAVRLGGDLSVQGTFQPTAAEFFGSNTQWVPETGVATLVDVVASGADVGFLSADISGSLFVTGTARFDWDGGFTMNVDGDLVVSGNGSFTTASNVTVTVLGNLETQDLGHITMGSPGELIDVYGHATFGGGSTSGELSEGTLQVAGDFTQSSSNSTESFAPHADFLTILGGTSAQQVSFDDASVSTSMFGDLSIQNVDAGGVILDSDIFVVDSLSTPGDASDRYVFGQGNTVTTRGINSYYLFFDNAPLIIEHDATSTTVAEIPYTTFQNMTDGVTQITFTRPDGSYFFGGVTFDNSITGTFIHLIDTNGGSDFSLEFDCPSPSDLTGRTQGDNTASVTWSCI